MAWAADHVGAQRPPVGLDVPTQAGRTRSFWARFECGWLLSFATLLAVSATLIMLAEAFSRSFLEHSYFWAEEAVRYLMVWAFFLSIGAAGRSGMHIRTELLVDRLPPRGQWLCHMAASLAGLVFAVILAVASVPQIERYYTMGMRTESTLDLPMWAVFLAMPVGAVLLGLYYLGCLMRAWRGEDPFKAQQGTVPCEDGRP